MFGFPFSEYFSEYARPRTESKGSLRGGFESTQVHRARLTARQLMDRYGQLARVSQHLGIALFWTITHEQLLHRYIPLRQPENGAEF